MRLLERHHIKPVLVFAGLPLAGRTLVGGGAARGPDPVAEREEHVKAEAWSHYETNDVEKTVAALSSVKKGAWTDHKDLLRTVLRVCRHRSVEYLVAPYLESAQVRQTNPGELAGVKDWAVLTRNTSWLTCCDTPRVTYTPCTRRRKP